MLPVAALVFVATLLLAFALPDREATFVACPVGVGAAEAERLGCGPEVDRRVPERIAIAGVGIVVGLVLISTARRYGRSAPERPPPMA